VEHRLHNRRSFHQHLSYSIQYSPAKAHFHTVASDAPIFHTSQEIRTYKFHPLMSSSKGRESTKEICPISLFKGLSTTPSSITALEKSIIEDTSTVENMKKSLLFTNDDLAFPYSNDSVLVPPTKDDSDILDQDCSNCFGPRNPTCKLHDK
jgi:hypothetical protein